MVPNTIHPPNSQAIYPAGSLVAGDTYAYEVQARDLYYNNAQTLATSLGSYSITATHSSGVTVSGTLVDKLDSPGVYTCTTTLTLAGGYMVNTEINGIAIENPDHQLTVTA